MQSYPIFVYGTLMRGERAHQLLVADSTRWCKALLPAAQLYLSPGGYPLAAEQVGDGAQPIGGVWGEVHWLRPSGYAALLLRLDQYEGDEYMRLLRKVVLPIEAGKIVQSAQTLSTAPTTATALSSTLTTWVYLSETNYASQHTLLASGDWRKRAHDAHC